MLKHIAVLRLQSEMSAEAAFVNCVHLFFKSATFVIVIYVVGQLNFHMLAHARTVELDVCIVRVTGFLCFATSCLVVGHGFFV